MTLITYDFTIKETPKDSESINSFDLVSYHDGSYICIPMNSNKEIENKKVNLNLGYLFQNGANIQNNVKVSYSISGNSYGTLKSGSFDVTSSCGKTNPVEIEISDAMKKQLETSAQQSTATSWIFGTGSSIEGRLSYNADVTYTDKTGKTTTKTINKKDLKVYFVASENCLGAQKEIRCDGTELTPKIIVNTIDNKPVCGINARSDCIKYESNTCYYVNEEGDRSSTPVTCKQELLNGAGQDSYLQ